MFSLESVMLYQKNLLSRFCDENTPLDLLGETMLLLESIPVIKVAFVELKIAKRENVSLVNMQAEDIACVTYRVVRNLLSYYIYTEV